MQLRIVKKSVISGDHSETFWSTWSAFVFTSIDDEVYGSFDEAILFLDCFFLPFPSQVLQADSWGQSALSHTSSTHDTDW